MCKNSYLDRLMFPGSLARDNKIRLFWAASVGISGLLAALSLNLVHMREKINGEVTPMLYLGPKFYG